MGGSQLLEDVERFGCQKDHQVRGVDLRAGIWGRDLGKGTNGGVGKGGFLNSHNRAGLLLRAPSSTSAIKAHHS